MPNNDYDLEDFMKSTNSALSDYNFLFENIDQQLQNNTQMMADELNKNVPDYLMNTNSLIKEDLKQSEEDSYERSMNMPKMVIKEPLRNSGGSIG